MNEWMNEIDVLKAKEVPVKNKWTDRSEFYWKDHWISEVKIVTAGHCLIQCSQHVIKFTVNIWWGTFRN